MSTRMQALARRRAQLLQQSAQQRTLIALHAEVWQDRLARLDHGLHIFKFMHHHAFLLGAGLWLLLRWQRSPSSHWYYRIFHLWRYYQQWRALRSLATASTDMDNRPAEMHTPFVINPP
ncbi:YqjK family protein [Methylovorus sp. MP688]|uniref:YqjK family protein n=1 Tax=Methylovorus sp. (strain MP688) TaxID=887061 RepID=UPI0001EC4F82|nr:YqjK family protein [Methylovorus sp. MP688]ADQ85737.1 conserved hypothetical protein [Methylovorus sp. MP688]